MENEEIKRALEICSTRTDLCACEECYCHQAGLRQYCYVKLKKDALALIKSLEARVAELTPPVEIGDEVLAIIEDENRVVSILHYTVEGLMVRDGKYYACGSDGDFNEVGSRLCLPPKYLDRQAVLGGLTGGVASSSAEDTSSVEEK